MNTSQGIWNAIKTPAFMGVIIPLLCLGVQPQLQWPSGLSGRSDRRQGYQLMQGSSESPTGPQTSHYARAVHTSHNEAFAIELNTYGELRKCLDNDAPFSVLSPDCYNIWMWNDTMTKRFECKVSALIWGYSDTSNEQAKQYSLSFFKHIPSLQLARIFFFFLTG